MRAHRLAILWKPDLHSQPVPWRLATALSGKVSAAAESDGEPNGVSTISSIAIREIRFRFIHCSWKNEAAVCAERRTASVR
jgi:hypothetical protein